jgi:hypothetical protein
LLHLAGMLTQAFGLCNNATTLLHGCMPPTCVARAPQPTSGLLVLRHHSFTADATPTGLPSEIPDDSLCKSRPGASCSNLTKREGLSMNP